MSWVVALLSSFGDCPLDEDNNDDDDNDEEEDTSVSASELPLPETGCSEALAPRVLSLCTRGCVCQVA